MLEPSSTVRLTPREEEIALMVAKGMLRKQIVRELKISKTAVDYHLRNVGNKLPGPGNPLVRIVKWAVLSGRSTDIAA